MRKRKEVRFRNADGEVLKTGKARCLTGPNTHKNIQIAPKPQTKFLLTKNPNPKDIINEAKEPQSNQHFYFTIHLSH